MHGIYSESQKGLEAAEEWMQLYTNLTRKEPPAYWVGDLVILNGHNIKIYQPWWMLDHKKYGPFQILKIISPFTVWPMLVWKWKIHNFFHISLPEPNWTMRQDRRTIQQFFSRQLGETPGVLSPEFRLAKGLSSYQRWGMSITWPTAGVVVGWRGGALHPFCHFEEKDLLLRYATKDHLCRPHKKDIVWMPSRNDNSPVLRVRKGIHNSCIGAHEAALPRQEPVYKPTWQCILIPIGTATS